MTYRSLLPLLVLLTSVSQLDAQEVQCVIPRAGPAAHTCTLMLDRDTATHYIIVRAHSGGAAAPGVRVSFLGPDEAQFEATTDTAGLAIMPWGRTLRGDSAVVHAAAHFPGGRVDSRRILIRASPRGSEYVIGKLDGDHAVWYAGRQIRYPMSVLITGPDATACPSARVIFRAIGGSATPDTISPQWRAPNQCVAESYWKLGETVGEQHLIASLVRDRSVEVKFQARARAVPRLFGGLAGGWRSPYATFDTATIAVVPVGGEGSTEAVVRLDSQIVQHSWDFDVVPVVGIDFPPLARWTRVRTSVGVSLRDPTREFFGGLSFPLLVGVGTEAIPLDFHLFGRGGRRDRIANPDTCEADRSRCSVTESFRFEGFGGMATFDGTALIGTLIKALGVP